MTEFSDILDKLGREDNLRHIPDEYVSGALDLSSNDYLSLGERCAEFYPEFFERFPDARFSSSASRLLSGQQKYHLQLEEFLSSLYGRPSLLFNSGYHANVGCISALTLPSTLFVCDRLIHASVVDGLRLAGARFVRFPHNDIIKLQGILDKETSSHERVLVVTESIFSMDGDEAPLEDLVALKKRYDNVFLYLDEAHAFGVRGERGLGLAEAYGLIDDFDLIIGTLGKAAASAGAFIITSDVLKDFMVNTARPFIFSTALPPVNAAWSILMIEKIIEMGKERAHLAKLSLSFKERLEEITGEKNSSESQIIPYITGDSAKALSIASRLRENGIIALPIRRPTVPPGGERIRFSLCSGMSRGDFDSLFKILQEI